jgi:predicted transcriptional regulator of viral defense system
VVAAAVLAPCYITGWSAAGNWDLTEQLYRVTAVISSRRLRERQPTVGGAEFMVITRPLPPEGRVTVWRDAVQVDVADPSLAVVDMLDDPRLGPGIREASRALAAYLRSHRRDDAALIRYGDTRGNGAVFKRLGLLIERLAPAEDGLLAACRDRLTQGYARLDPGIDAPGKRRKRWLVIENARIPGDDHG